MTNTAATAKTSPIAKLFRWIRPNGTRVMRQTIAFGLDAEELAECLVWHKALEAEDAEELRLTAKLCKEAAEAFIWRNGHPIAADRDLDNDEQEAVEILARRIKDEVL
jgi:hypothetical protein